MARRQDHGNPFCPALAETPPSSAFFLLFCEMAFKTPRMATSNELRIACYIHGAESYGHSALRGIAEWSRTQPQCRIINYTDMAQLTLVQPHGILAQLGHPRSIEPARALRPLPILNISAALPDIPFPTVTTDNRAVGAAGAAHLFATGVADFAFARNPWTEYSRLRAAGFEEKILDMGGKLHAEFVQPKTEKSMTDGHPYPPSLPAWLEGLPRPCGIMTDSDNMAKAITYCASRLGLRIPRDFPLITADQEHWLNELTDPPLSCVPLPGRLVGWRAAERLARHIREGEPLPESPLLIAPEPVIVRQSSDILYHGDEAVRRAIAYIRLHANQRVSVPDVAAAAGTNRRTLEMKFKRHLRRTILETIHQTHVQEALRLLRDTRLPMGEVCEKAGFPNPQRFNLIIKAETGLPPMAYRKEHQPG